MLHECFNSRLFLPNWWVKAYETTLINDLNDLLDPFYLSRESGLFPALTTTELTGIGVLFSFMQQSILSGSLSAELCPIKHRKFNSLPGRAKTFAFERVLQLLGSLRICDLPLQQDVHLFEQDRWDHSSGNPKLVVQFSEFGRELILGYVEPYHYLKFFVESDFRQHSFCSKQPLAINQSVWLDLQGPEQVVFLRLEKAMQWYSSLVSLDGSYSAEFLSIFNGMSFKNAKPSKGSSFTRRLSILGKIGRKLVDHGLLDRELPDEYLIVNPAGGLEVIWKAMPSQIYSEDLKHFEDLVAQYFCRNILTPQLNETIRILAGKLFSQSLLNQLNTLWSGLMSDAKAASSMIVSKMGGRMLLAAPLFLEWVIRCLPGHDRPIPQSLRVTELGLFFGAKIEESMTEKFIDFSKLLEARSDLIEAIMTTKGGTLTSNVSMVDSSLYSFIQHRKMAAVSVSPEKPKSLPIESKAKTERRSDNGIRLERKQAIQELHRLRTQEPESYVKLKEAYLGSLDLQSKKIISEVQRRVQPSVFDDHIKHSLVKYMVEHEAAWRQGMVKISRTEN